MKKMDLFKDAELISVTQMSAITAGRSAVLSDSFHDDIGDSFHDDIGDSFHDDIGDSHHDDIGDSHHDDIQ